MGEQVQCVDMDNVQCLSNENSSDDEDERQYQEDVKESERKADITIGSSVTCIQFENPDEVAFSIAPGQNAIPKFILMDECFEALAFPNLLPYGKFGFDVLQPRDRELNLRRYVNQRLLNKDARFSQNMEYIFAFQYATELKTVAIRYVNGIKKTMFRWEEDHCWRHEKFSEGEPDDMERYSIQVHEKCTRNSCILASSTL